MSLDEALWSDPDRMSGALCFRGTRIPVSVLFDYLVADGISEFYEGYPDVGPEQVQVVIDASRTGLEGQFQTKVAA